MARKKKKTAIFQHGKKWRYDTYYRGHRLRESYATEEAAEEILRKVKTLIDEERYLEKRIQSTITVGEFAGQYLQWCKDQKQKAAESKKSHLDSIKDYFGKDTLLCEVTKEQVESYKGKLASSQSRRKSTFAVATVNRRMACLRHLFSKALDWGEGSNQPSQWSEAVQRE